MVLVCSRTQMSHSIYNFYKAVNGELLNQDGVTVDGTHAVTRSLTFTHTHTHTRLVFFLYVLPLVWVGSL